MLCSPPPFTLHRARVPCPAIEVPTIAITILADLVSSCMLRWPFFGTCYTNHLTQPLSFTSDSVMCMLTYMSRPRFVDVLALRQLRHRRSSLPSILEDSRALFKESLREQEKKLGRSSDKDSSSSRHPPDTFHPSALSHSSSSSHRRPALKSALSTPDVGRVPQVAPPPKPVDPHLHASTPISREHRRRRISLPNGLEAAVKSSSHALWLPHHTEAYSNEHPTSHTNGHSSSHPRSSTGALQPHSTTNGQHARPTSHSHSIPQTPRHYNAAQLPSDVHEQPQLWEASYSAPPPVTFTKQQPSINTRPVSQLTTSTHRSSKSSPPEKKSSPLPSPVPAMLTQTPHVKQANEPQTPK
jgi:hypothetical protein